MKRRALRPCYCGTVHGGFDDIHPHCAKANAAGLREGADRERRRIRREQAGALDELRKRRDIDVDYFDAQLAALDDATKAPKRGRR